MSRIDYLKMSNEGQIKYNQEIGQFIIDLFKDHTIKNVLEIGTWNGRGSTICFYLGMLLNNRTDVMIESLEINLDKFNEACNFWNPFPRIKIRFGSILHNIDVDEIYKIFPNLNKTWLEIDLGNNKISPFLPMNESYDVVLLDGGEYTTIFEYRLLKKRTKIFILDDTNVDKCKLIQDELIKDNNWECLLMSNERNGVSAFKKK